MKLSNIPLRLAAGSYILNAGVTLLEDRERAAELHKTAASSYPVLGELSPDQFLLLLGGSEAALGTALLLPFVRPRQAGLPLAGFAGGLLGMYARNEHFRRSARSLRPSGGEGEALAKDLWLLGIALALMLGRARPKRLPAKRSPAASSR
jgi:hypothetical protein